MVRKKTVLPSLQMNIFRFCAPISTMTTASSFFQASFGTIVGTMALAGVIRAGWVCNPRKTSMSRET